METSNVEHGNEVGFLQSWVNTQPLEDMVIGGPADTNSTNSVGTEDIEGILGAFLVVGTGNMDGHNHDSLEVIIITLKRILAPFQDMPGSPGLGQPLGRLEGGRRP